MCGAKCAIMTTNVPGRFLFLILCSLCQEEIDGVCYCVFAILHVKWSAQHLCSFQSPYFYFSFIAFCHLSYYTFCSRSGRGCLLIFRIYPQLWLRKYLVPLMKQTHSMTSLLFNNFPSFWLTRYALPCHSFVWPLGSLTMCGGPAPVERGCCGRWWYILWCMC